jgi:hypothetical protein
MVTVTFLHFVKLIRTLRSDIGENTVAKWCRVFTHPLLLTRRNAWHLSIALSWNIFSFKTKKKGINYLRNFKV